MLLHCIKKVNLKTQRQRNIYNRAAQNIEKKVSQSQYLYSQYQYGKEPRSFLIILTKIWKYLSVYDEKRTFRTDKNIIATLDTQMERRSNVRLCTALNHSIYTNQLWS